VLLFENVLRAFASPIFCDMVFPVKPLDEQTGIFTHIVQEAGKINALSKATDRTLEFLKDALAVAAGVWLVDPQIPH
jgi:hypothetical protein